MRAAPAPAAIDRAAGGRRAAAGRALLRSRLREVLPAPADPDPAVVLHLHGLVADGPLRPDLARPRRLHRHRRLRAPCCCGTSPGSRPGSAFPVGIAAGGRRWRAGRLSLLPLPHHRPLFRAADAGADRVRAAVHRRPARLHRRLARHPADALRRRRLALCPAVRAGPHAGLLHRLRAVAVRPVRVAARRPQHGPLRARRRQPGRGRGGVASAST